MATTIKVEETTRADADSSNVVDTSAAEAALKARLSRKRTKSGCLTCRKRRIKCGEERPVCKNCVKSKRHCEGYNQRVIFKPPTFDFRPVSHGGAHITFQAGPIAGPAASAFQGSAFGQNPGPAIFTQLRPRPSAQYEHSFAPQIPFYDNSAPPGFEQGYPGFPALPQYYSNTPIPHQQLHDHANISRQGHTGNVPATQPFRPDLQVQRVEQHVHTTFEAYQVHHHGATDPRLTAHGATPSHIVAQKAAPSQQQPWNGPNTTVSANAPPLGQFANQISPVSSRSSHTLSASHSTVSPDGAQTWQSYSYVPRPELIRPIDWQPPVTTTAPLPFDAFQIPSEAPKALDHATPIYYEQEPQLPPTNSPAQVLNQAAVEMEDDDYFDVESDEEMELDTMTSLATNYEHQRTLGAMLAMNKMATGDLNIRRYDTFIFKGMLDSYRPERVANPLKNPSTARVFAHFISATGPSLSIFERHPRNASMLFSDGLVPFSQQGLWTYTMPMAALHHQGLLHAMLALASLHIAKLQGASSTPSYRHYAWALKRVHHCVGHPKKRHQMTTLAASLLLGFYEVMTADHMKWNSHLLGAKQLIVETDFAGMARQFKSMKAQRATGTFYGNQGLPGGRRPSSSHVYHDEAALDQIPVVDERIVSMFAGREVRYDDHGRVIGTPSLPEPLDLSKFEILKDLFWWYCKQDVYQSIVSGNPLLMPFSRWTDCPPRAPLGKADAVHGSFDHLVLLLGRIADFSSRDRSRKLRVMASQGGAWRPAPGMRLGPPPGQAAGPRPPVAAPPTGSLPLQNPNFQPGPPHGRTGPSQPAPNGPPPQVPFFGMAPPPANVQMPSSYTGASSASASPLSDNSMDLEVATQTAMEEYGQIRGALHDFSARLGEVFQPLTEEYQPPLQTPFGAALFYRSYDIGVLWAIYNMAVIIAIRSHPHMPPAAHMAAGVAAGETAFFANQIGRIAAAIVPGPSNEPLNPSLGAALCESCMPSFFAAVQYRDAEQRHSTVMRIFSIEQRTGWGSAGLIANGCETAWVKAAAAGRGPPYERVVRNAQSEDPRLNGSWERLDPNSLPNSEDDNDRRFVRSKAAARLNWAIGVMGMEDDIEKLDDVSGRD